MKWIDDGYHIYCPSCVEQYRARGTEPDFEKPGHDHCEMCGAEYFDSPPGILKRFKQRAEASVTGVEMDDIRVGAIKRLKEWYERYPGYTDEYIKTLDQILEV